MDAECERSWTETWADCLLKHDPFIARGDGTRVHFTQLLILDFLASHVYLRSRPISWNYGIGWSRVNVVMDPQISPTEPLTEPSEYRTYLEVLISHQELLRELYALADAIDFVGMCLLAELPDDVALSPYKRHLSSKIWTLQHICRQRLECAERSKNSLIQGLKIRDRELDIQESISVKRLTILATVFLPLSLSASILSMQSRFIELKLKLYDFIGVFVIVGSAAVLILQLVKLTSKVKSKFGRMISPRAHWVRGYIHDRRWGSGYQSAAALCLPILYFLSWAILFASFIFGMVRNATLGLKILGCELAALLAIMIAVGLCMRSKRINRWHANRKFEMWKKGGRAVKAQQASVGVPEQA